MTNLIGKIVQGIGCAIIYPVAVISCIVCALVCPVIQGVIAGYDLWQGLLEE